MFFHNALKCVHKDLIDKNLTLFWVMVWSQIGGKPLSVFPTYTYASPSLTQLNGHAQYQFYLAPGKLTLSAVVRIFGVFFGVNMIKLLNKLAFKYTYTSFENTVSDLSECTIQFNSYDHRQFISYPDKKYRMNSRSFEDLLPARQFISAVNQKGACDLGHISQCAIMVHVHWFIVSI